MAFDPTAAMQAFAQAQLQQQREYFANQNRRLDMSGNVIDPTTGKGPGNPFDTGFFKSGAAQLTPQQLALSQGGNAMNQWAGMREAPQGPTMSGAPMQQMPQFAGQAPAQRQDPMSFGQQGARAFVMPPVFSVNDAQGQALPGGPQWQGLPPGDPRAAQPQNYYPKAQAVPQPQQPRQPQQRRLGSGRRLGSSFGFNASPSML
jgi:hypothetical protein